MAKSTKVMDLAATLNMDGAGAWIQRSCKDERPDG